MTSLTGTLRILPPRLKPTTTKILRTFTSTSLLKTDGATGSIRSQGERAADSWTKREKAAEDLYIREHEKTIMKQLREKIAAQEAILKKDRVMLQAMEDGYGKAVLEGGEGSGRSG